MKSSIIFVNRGGQGCRITSANVMTLSVSRRGPSLIADIALAVTLVAIGVMYQMPGLSSAPNNYDEGLIVYGAARVMNGQIPYRDFWTLYGPGQFYVLALLFSIFEPSIMVERLYDITVRAILAFAIYLVASQLSNRRIALLSWLISLVWLTYFGFYGYPIFIAMLFVMLSFKVLISSFTQLSLRWVAGAITGVVVLFRHDIGAYAVFSQIIVLLSFEFFMRTDKNKPILRRFWDMQGAIVPFIAGVMIVDVPVVLFFLITVPDADLAQQIFFNDYCLSSKNVMVEAFKQA